MDFGIAGGGCGEQCDRCVYRRIAGNGADQLFDRSGLQCKYNCDCDSSAGRDNRHNECVCRQQHHTERCGERRYMEFGGGERERGEHNGCGDGHFIRNGTDQLYYRIGLLGGGHGDDQCAAGADIGRGEHMSGSGDDIELPRWRDVVEQ